MGPSIRWWAPALRALVVLVFSAGDFGGSIEVVLLVRMMVTEPGGKAQKLAIGWAFFPSIRKKCAERSSDCDAIRS